MHAILCLVDFESCITFGALGKPKLTLFCSLTSLPRLSAIFATLNEEEGLSSDCTPPRMQLTSLFPVSIFISFTCNLLDPVVLPSLPKILPCYFV